MTAMIVMIVIKLNYFTFLKMDINFEVCYRNEKMEKGNDFFGIFVENLNLYFGVDTYFSCCEVVSYFFFIKNLQTNELSYECKDLTDNNTEFYNLHNKSFSYNNLIEVSWLFHSELEKLFDDHTIDVYGPSAGIKILTDTYEFNLVAVNSHDGYYPHSVLFYYQDKTDIQEI